MNPLKNVWNLFMCVSIIKFYVRQSILQLLRSQDSFTVIEPSCNNNGNLFR